MEMNGPLQKDERNDSPDLSELLQFFALRQDPLELTIESSSCQRGWIVVSEGNIVRAETAGGKLGFEAFVEILSWDQPQVVEVLSTIVDDQNIERALPQLLLETFWESREHEPTDPPQPPLPMGLEEDTVSREDKIGPPDGVTKEVLELAQWMSELKGFVALALICPESGAVLDTFGKRKLLDVPEWCLMAAQALSRDECFEKHVSVYEDYIDVILPPFEFAPIAYFLRMNRTLTNQGLVDAALKSMPKFG